MRFSSPLILGLALAGLSELPLGAQTVVLVRNGQLQSGNFGAACDGAGPIDADGVPDFVGGADRTTPNQQFAGTGTAHSGADGSVLYEYNGNTAFQYLGQAVAGVGDINGDGRGDFVIATGNEDIGGANAGRARVYSGLTGGLLFSFVGASAGDGLGSSVDGAGRIDANPRPDIIVGAPGNDANGNGAGAAYVYSGQTGLLLRTFLGSGPGAALGTEVSKAGDVDDDGVDDVMVSAPGESTASTRGRVIVYSGANGSVLHSFTGSLDDGGYGSSLAGPGDLNGDDHADLVVGASGATVNGVSGGAVYVYSGLDGSILYSFSGDSSGDSMGEAVGDGGDCDGDGTPDLLIGVPRSSENGIFSGHVRVISGATGTEFFRVEGTSSSDRLGTSCAILGDVNGNGLDDVLVGAPGAVQQRGRCYIFAYDGVADAPYCDAVANSSGFPSMMSAAGSDVAADQNLTLSASHQPLAGNFGLFFFGPDQIQVPFGDGFRCVGGMTWRVQPPASASAGLVTSRTLNFGAPYAAQIVGGTSLNFQLWYRDTMAMMAGYNLTNGLNIEFR